MELKIGVQNSPREIVIESDEQPADVQKRLNEALSAGTLFEIVDTKGRTILVPGDKVSYVEIGAGVSGTVGFR
jgi:hypothetical protein